MRNCYDMKVLKYILLLIILHPCATYSQQSFDVYFDFDKYDLNEQAIITLNTLIANARTPEVLKIYGFCDWKGSNSYNDSLSVKRVYSVYNYLLDNNIDVAKDYELRGFGKKFEQSKNQGENRKVMVVYDFKENEQAVANDASKVLSEKVLKSVKGEMIKLDDINFYNMSPRIQPESRNVMLDLLCVMQDNPTLKIEIQGHICCQLEDKNNLSTMRAKAIYNFLVSRRIHRNRLSYKGFGVSKPIHKIPEENEKQRYENRRVEIMIVEK